MNRPTGKVASAKHMSLIDNWINILIRSCTLQDPQ